jgi:pyridoxamine 5'-phosphate oxidase
MLDEKQVSRSPFQQFRRWFRDAADQCPGSWFDPTAMTLATTDKRGKVTARIVLLKRFDNRGFTFFTNYRSRKGQQLSQNPRAALVFYWPYLRRQVRVEGGIQRVSRSESLRYFRSRPRLSQLAAVVSSQSEVIPSRKFLDDRFDSLRLALGSKPVPLPDYWGGWRVLPHTLEFWEHRDNRLHDRIRYSKKQSGGWRIERLSP